MSKRNRQQRAAKRAQAQKLVRQPTPIAPLPRVFPTVREPFYLPDLLGMTPRCWQGGCPPHVPVPVITSRCV